MNRIWLLIIIVVAAVLYFVFNKQSVKDHATEAEHTAETVIEEVKDAAKDLKDAVVEDAAVAAKPESESVDKVEEVNEVKDEAHKANADAAPVEAVDPAVDAPAEVAKH